MSAEAGSDVGPDQLRLSDAERETASHALGEHFAQGRLDADEHAERHERVWSAKTRGDIPPLFADLPGGSPLHPPTPRLSPLQTQPWVAPSHYQRPRRRGVPLPLKIAFGIVVAVLVISNWWLVLIALGVAWILSHKGGRRPRHSPRGYAGRGPCSPSGRWSTS